MHLAQFIPTGQEPGRPVRDGRMFTPPFRRFRPGLSASPPEPASLFGWPPPWLGKLWLRNSEVSINLAGQGACVNHINTTYWGLSVETTVCCTANAATSQDTTNKPIAWRERRGRENHQSKVNCSANGAGRQGKSEGRSSEVEGQLTLDGPRRGDLGLPRRLPVFPVIRHASVTQNESDQFSKSRL